MQNFLDALEREKVFRGLRILELFGDISELFALFGAEVTIVDPTVRRLSVKDSFPNHGRSLRIPHSFTSLTEDTKFFSGKKEFFDVVIIKWPQFEGIYDVDAFMKALKATLAPGALLIFTETSEIGITGRVLEQHGFHKVLADEKQQSLVGRTQMCSVNIYSR